MLPPLAIVDAKEIAETAPDDPYKFKIAPVAIVDTEPPNLGNSKNYLFLLTDSKNSGGASLHEMSRDPLKLSSTSLNIMLSPLKSSLDMVNDSVESDGNIAKKENHRDVTPQDL